MRVLFVTHNFPRRPGDLPGSFILRLARALRELGVDIHVVAPHAPGLAESATVDGITITRFRYAQEHRETLAYEGTMAEQVRGSLRAKVDLMAMIRAATREIKRRAAQVDVVHAHWWFPLGMAATTRALHGRPLVTTLHGSDVRFVRSALARTLMRHVVGRAARVTAVSRWLASETQRLAGVANVTVAPMPVEVELFTPSDIPRHNILFVGKLDAQKGAHVLLEALAHMQPSITATIVGDGPDSRALHTRAATLGVAGRVLWTGALAHEALPAYYRAARVVIAPATEPEGLGLVAAEALLCETPVIASNIGGLSDLVEDGVTGRLVAANDPVALANAMESALSSPERLEQWGRAGRARVLARMSPAACAATYRTIYEEVVRGRGA